MNDYEAKKLHDDSKRALNAIVKRIKPAVSDVLRFATNPKNWVYPQSSIDDAQLAKHSISFGDILISYAIEDHSKKGVFQVLTLTLFKDYMTLPEQVIIEIIRLFMGENSTNLRVMREVATDSVVAATGEPVAKYAVVMAIASYEKPRIYLP